MNGVKPRWPSEFDLALHEAVRKYRIRVRTITLSTLKQELADGIGGRRCVEAWLGYGQPLFLVLGDHAALDPEHAERHPHPHYQIQTHDADWWVEEGAEIRGTADDEREHAEAACKLL